MLNFSYRKVGGLRFVKLGRLGFMFWVSKKYKPIKSGRLEPFKQTWYDDPRSGVSY